MKLKNQHINSDKTIFTNVKSNSHIALIIILGSLVALIIWQVKQAKEDSEVYLENKYQNVVSELFSIANLFKEFERDLDLIDDTDLKKKKYLDSVLGESVLIKDLDFIWKIENTDTISAKSINKQFNKKASICLSCLITINLVGSPDDLNKVKSKRDDASFILKHSPAQMVSMRNFKPENIKYLNFYYNNSIDRASSYLIPIIFLLIMASMSVWLLLLISKQRRLIRQKNEFVNHLSHQFQTPLSSIKMSSNLLLKDNTIEKEPLIKIIQKESNRLENHIKTVLHWVKSDADRLQLHFKPIRLTDVVERCITQMKPVFLSTDTIIIFIPPEEEYIIKADEEHLELLLFNIWENSIKHNSEPITIMVEIKKNEQWISICSQDNGQGVKTEENNIKYKGLGLAYIDEIMVKHKGNMQLIKGEEKGFSVILNFKK